MKRSEQRRRDRAARRRQLRAVAMARSGGRCEAPGCTNPPEHMAHTLEGVGAGGRASADRLDNVAMLCTWHHDLLDGRQHHGARRFMGQMLQWIVLRRAGAWPTDRSTDEGDSDG